MQLKSICAILLLCLIGACEQSDKPKFEGRTVLYEHRGLAIRYPELWSVESDGPSDNPPADRQVLINVFGESKASIIFFNKIPMINGSVSNFEAEVEILSREEGFTLDETPIAGFPSVTFSWVSGEPPKQNSHKLLNIQLLQQPYDVIVAIELFNDDIEFSEGFIVPFIQSIVFDPNTLEL